MLREMPTGYLACETESISRKAMVRIISFFIAGYELGGGKGGPGAAGASRIGYFTQHEPQMSPPWVLQLEARSPPTYLPTKIPFFEELPMNAE